MCPASIAAVMRVVGKLATARAAIARTMATITPALHRTGTRTSIPQTPKANLFQVHDGPARHAGRLHVQHLHARRQLKLLGRDGDELAPPTGCFDLAGSAGVAGCDFVFRTG